MHCTLLSSLQRVQSVPLVPDESDAYETTKQPRLTISISTAAQSTYVTPGVTAAAPAPLP